MRLHRFRRSASLLLLAILLVGGPGLPWLDALLYHSSDTVDRRGVTHVESTNALCHAEHCVADAVLQDRVAPPPDLTASLAVSAPLVAVALPAGVHPRPRTSDYTAPPRAPPIC